MDVASHRSVIRVFGTVAILVANVLAISSCSSENKCGQSPVLHATWPGHSMLLYRCGVSFGEMPSGNPSSAENGDGADIQMKVGQQLTITKYKGWSGHTLSGPVTDTPTVLQLASSSSAGVVAVYVAVGPGLADFGAHSDLCENAARGCQFGDVQVSE